MMVANTDLAPLEQTLKALLSFEAQTTAYAHHADLLLDDFEQQVRMQRGMLVERIEELGACRRDHRSGEGERTEFERMLDEEDEEGRRELAQLESRLDRLDSLASSYAAYRDQCGEQVKRLMQGDVLSGGTSAGLRSLIDLLRTYLEL